MVTKTGNKVLELCDKFKANKSDELSFTITWWYEEFQKHVVKLEFVQESVDNLLDLDSLEIDQDNVTDFNETKIIPIQVAYKNFLKL